MHKPVYRYEVASLQLEDIQWRARVIRVPRPKIGTPLDMPLTDEVATALLEYLRHRTSESAEATQAGDQALQGQFQKGSEIAGTIAA